MGPALDEVREKLSDLDGVAVVSEAYPEVLVETRAPAVAKALLSEFGTSIYSLTGASLEEVVGGLLIATGRTLATAESCTGGLIGHRVTNVPGSSAYYRMGFVTYSNQAKVDLLDVPGEIIDREGAVAEDVARNMVKGALSRSGADLAVSVSGIAGPGGGTPGKPIGTVWFAAGSRGDIGTVRKEWQGDRERVKHASACQALDMIRRLCIGAPLS